MHTFVQIMHYSVHESQLYALQQCSFIIACKFYSMVGAKICCVSLTCCKKRTVNIRWREKEVVGVITINQVF